MAMPLRKKINSGKSVIGTMLSLVSNPNIVYILKSAGFDFVFIDCEHGAFSMPQVSALSALCRAVDLGVIVRVPQPDRASIQKYSDMGIDGVMLPMLDSVDEAKNAARFARYRPRGIRGMGLGPLVDYRTGVDMADLIRQINEDYIILAQIETRKGVEDIDAIMDVDGIDGCAFGVNDMSISYDLPGQIYEPIFRENIKKVLDATRRRGKILCHHFFGYQDLEWGLEQGVQMVTWHTDVSALQAYYQSELSKIKAMPNFKS